MFNALESGNDDDMARHCCESTSKTICCNLSTCVEDGHAEADASSPLCSMLSPSSARPRSSNNCLDSEDDDEADEAEMRNREWNRLADHFYKLGYIEGISDAKEASQVEGATRGLNIGTPVGLAMGSAMGLARVLSSLTSREQLFENCCPTCPTPDAIQAIERLRTDIEDKCRFMRQHGEDRAESGQWLEEYASIHERVVETYTSLKLGIPMDSSICTDAETLRGFFRGTK